MVREFFQFNSIEKKLLGALLLCVVCAVGAYGVLVRQTIVHGVARKALERDIAALSAATGDLEAAYIKATGAITLEDAEIRGFAEKQTAFFVSRAPQTLSLR